MPTPRFLADKLCPVRAKRERRKEARPGELLEAALDLFVEKGFAATRSEEVAARAGVSKGTLFLYFPSKEELFKAVIRENLSGRFGEWNQEFEAFEGSTPDMLRYVMRVWWERVGSTKVSGITKLMMSEGGNFPELARFYQTEVVQPGHELLRRVIRRGIERGEFKGVDVDLAIYTVLAPMIFLMLSKHSGNICMDPGVELDPEKYITLQAETLLGGLCTPDGSGA
ncbi:TetR/AcrR family transcriptional regulator [Variovorax sp. J22G21]|uniref:TetR/AcrR family transcriptional regulator n=1 Tax=Variovorax fucosicus TaxID=3053517 RepID=UPI0025788A80|nr:MULTISPECIES: TetR/AcrR family transcriptional regulator [unclassified Variovorax]MDM0040786.1 TetR/AcrR family transcriptional regulator [Variovorax sp. J22R193]MDM0062159.1 TetR/AcrR family transcriptional regulator [Variovorax sp. J22G21]